MQYESKSADGREFSFLPVEEEEKITLSKNKINNLLFNNRAFYDRILYAGIIRNRRAGDSYRPVGRSGSRGAAGNIPLRAQSDGIQEIRNWKPGDKLPSEKELTELFGVSRGKNTPGLPRIVSRWMDSPISASIHGELLNSM